MVENKAPGWGDLTSRSNFGHPDVLYFQKNQRYVVRLLDDVLPELVMFHSCPEAGLYINVLCIGSRQGCRLCEVNSREEHVQKDAGKKPYPFRSQFVKAVWVYELKAMRFLVGKAVWEKQIKPLGERYGTLANRDLEIIRQDTNGQVSYTAVPIDVAPFTIVVDPKTIPSIKPYKEWLQSNINKINLLSPGETEASPVTGGTYAPPPPTPTPPALAAPSASVPPAAAVPQSVAPAAAAPTPTALPAAAVPQNYMPSTAVAPAPGVAAPPGGLISLSPEQEVQRQQFQAEFSTLMSKKFEPTAVQAVMSVHAKGRQLEQMHPEEIRAMIVDYTGKVGL